MHYIPRFIFFVSFYFLVLQKIIYVSGVQAILMVQLLIGTIGKVVFGLTDLQSQFLQCH